MVGMARFDDVSTRADRLREAEELERDCRRALEEDESCDPYLMMTWQRSVDLRARARESYEDAFTDWADGDTGAIL
jgi:hypothetical protein